MIVRLNKYIFRAILYVHATTICSATEILEFIGALLHVEIPLLSTP